MNFELLQAFIFALDYGSFSDAAKARFVTPSTQSKQIKALEDDLGVKLFKRTPPQGMVPTEAAYTLAPIARDIVTNLSQLKDRASIYNTHGNRILRIGYLGFDFEKRIIEAAVTRLVEDHGPIDLELFRIAPKDQSRMVRDGICDLCLATAVGEPPASDLCLEVIGRPLVEVVVPFDHPLATQKSVSASQLTNETLIFVNSITALPSYNTTISVLAAEVDPHPFIKHVQNYMDLDVLVACRQGIGFTTEWNHDLVLDNIVRVPFANDALAPYVTVVFPPETHNPLIRQFVEHARAFARTLSS